MRLPRLRFTVRRLMATVAVVAVSLAVVPPVLTAIDAANHGPFATWFNHDCQRRADEAVLVGRPEKDVTAVLGPPSYTYEYQGGNGRMTRTYNYAPSGLFPTAKFQVHCQNGIVMGVEQFDD
jgi:hypothetical protein